MKREISLSGHTLWQNLITMSMSLICQSSVLQWRSLVQLCQYAGKLSQIELLDQRRIKLLGGDVLSYSIQDFSVGDRLEVQAGQCSLWSSIFKRLKTILFNKDASCDVDASGLRESWDEEWYSGKMWWDKFFEHFNGQKLGFMFQKKRKKLEILS